MLLAEGKVKAFSKCRNIKGKGLEERLVDENTEFSSLQLKTLEISKFLFSYRLGISILKQ